MTFDQVTALALTWPNVEATTKYDGSPVLKVRGCFLAGLATHQSAERDTLVVRHDVTERDAIIEDAPETYYLTDYYRPYPLLLARLSRLDEPALRDLLAITWRLAMAKTRHRRGGQRRSPTRVTPHAE